MNLAEQEIQVSQIVYEEKVKNPSTWPMYP